MYLAPLDGDWGTIGDKCRARLLTQCFGELFAIKSGNVSVEFEDARVPDFPARMLDAIFAAATAKRGVTPVMFGDELGVGSCCNPLRLTSGAHFE